MVLTIKVCFVFLLVYFFLLKYSCYTILYVIGVQYSDSQHFIVTIKYWVYSLCCTIYAFAYFIPSSLYILIHYPYTNPPHFSLPTSNHSLFSVAASLFLFVIFTSFFSRPSSVLLCIYFMSSLSIHLLMDT